MSGPLETVYDAEIAPLMSQIIDICKRAGIAVHVAFALDDDLGCTTHIPSGAETKAAAEWRRKYEPLARSVSRPGGVLMLTTRDAQGNVKSMEAILP